MALGVVEFAHDFYLVLTTLDVLVGHKVSILSSDVRLSNGLLESVAILASSQMAYYVSVSVYRFQSPNRNLNFKEILISTTLKSPHGCITCSLRVKNANFLFTPFSS